MFISLGVQLCLAAPPQWQWGAYVECEGWQSPLVPPPIPRGSSPTAAGADCGAAMWRDSQVSCMRPRISTTAAGRTCAAEDWFMGAATGSRHREQPEAMCACRASGSACGSGGCSHPNLCELRKAASQRDTILRLTGQELCDSEKGAFIT